MPISRHRLAALACSLAAFLAYARTLAPTVLPGDSGEFQFAAPLLGLAHPTGYPLYLLLGKLWTLLVPIGDAAFRMNLLSAVFSAAAVGMLALLGRRLGMSAGAAAVAALALAFSRTFWSQAVRAEVYALNSFFTVLLLLLACSMADDPRPRLRGAFFLTLGLALAHHRMILLLLPALWLAAQGEGPSRTMYPPARPRPLAVSALLLLPLLLYLYIPLRAPATPYADLPVPGGPPLATYDNTPAGFVSMVAGSVFRGSLGPQTDGALGDRLALAARLATAQLGELAAPTVPGRLLQGLLRLVTPLLAGLGLAALLARRARWGLALGLAYAATLAFCLVYAVGDIADFFTPTYIVAALWLGLGVQTLADAAGRVAGSPGRAAAPLLCLLVPLSMLPGNLAAVDLSQSTATRTAWTTLLSLPLEHSAVLVSNDRDEMTPMWYMQYVEGRRRDLVGLFPKVRPETQFADLGGLLDWLLQRGVRPYLIKPMPGLELKYDLEKETDGPLPRVAGVAVDARLQPQRPLAASFGGLLALQGADVAGAAAAGSTITVTVYWQPLARMTENYHTFVQLQTKAGQRLAGNDQRPGGQFYPTSGWNPGDRLADRHVLALPADLAPGTYRLVTGVYRYPSLERLPLAGAAGNTADLGEITVR